MALPGDKGPHRIGGIALDIFRSRERAAHEMEGICVVEILKHHRATMIKPDPKVTAAARPMRIAYVLEDGVDSHTWLDEIIAKCFARHGGRQSLIVPSINGSISARYAAWLKVLDPDVVVLVTYQNDEVAAQLGTLLGDTVLKQRTRTRGEAEAYPRVDLEQPALTSLSWIPFFKTVSGVRRQPIECVLDRYPAWLDDGLIKDNFGTLIDSFSRFPIHEEIGIRPIMLTPDNPPENRWHFKIFNVDEVQDGYTILEDFPRNGISTLSHLSNLNCQPFRPTHAWREEFCLVIGDSLTDRIACWNAGLLFDDATMQPVKTLRVPSLIAIDTDKTNKVASFLRRANWLGGHSGPSRIAVRSHSLDEASLAVFIERLRAAARSIVTFTAITSIDDCCPENSADMHPAYHAFVPSPTSTETAASKPTTFVEAPAPFHLKYTAGQHPILSEGAWYVDLAIDKFDDHGRYSNVRQVWMLPKRRQLIRKFLKVDGARILRFGGLALPIDVNVPSIEVNQPDDETLFRALLIEVGHHASGDVRYERDKQPSFRYVEPSDKGRYLAGLLGIFGSLSDIENIMNTRFWRRQFYAMGTPANEQRAELIKNLKRRLAGRTDILHFESTDDWGRLADHVVQLGSNLKVPRLRTRYDWLLKSWLAELREAICLEEYLKQQEDSIVADAPDELNASLAFLVARRVFYRGHEWVCRNCSHRNWAAIHALADAMPCEVCATEHHLPVDVAMDFRLNEFFATCLREHDTLTVACILAALRQEASAFFTFFPQAAIYRKYPEDQNERPSRELDILCISDGKFVIGEAKARAESIRPSDISDLAEAAKDLGVDIAILAALSDERSVMPAKLEQLRNLLPNTIEIRSIVTNWNDEPSTYLAGKTRTYSL